MALNLTATLDRVEALYVGYFARPADPAGLNYWMGQFDTGAITLPRMAASFAVQTETLLKYPYLADPQTGEISAFVDQVYVNLFNRVADLNGKIYWQGQLTAANNDPTAIATFILNVISGAQGNDALTLTNKLAVAAHFTNGLANANLPYTIAADAEGRSELLATDFTAASVAANMARADAYLTPESVPPGQTFALAAASASVDEGQHDLVTLTTTNVSAGTVLGYTITGIAASRVTGPLTGTVTVDSSGQATIDLGIIVNNLTDGATTAVIRLDNNLAFASIAVNDTSIAPPVGATFFLAPQSATVNEGQVEVISVITTNVPAGTQLGYTITNISASRVSGGLTGVVTIDAFGNGSINVPIVANGVTDGLSSAVVSLNNGTSSATFLINDTSVETSGVIITPSTGADNLVGTAGPDTFAGTFSDGGTNSFSFGDTLSGLGGTDTLAITPAIPTAAATLTDGLWTGVSSVENISITTGAGVITMTTGAAFEAAFADSGIVLTATTDGGAINLDLSAFTGTETLTTSSGAGAQTIVTGSGASTVVATSTAGALIIHGTGLTAVTATTTGAGAQTIGDLIGGGANLVSVTAVAAGGAQTILSTSTSAVTVNATVIGGPQIITTGAGNDTIVIGNSAALGTINAGAGSDSITLGATHSGVNTIVVTLGQSVQTAFDTITNFKMTPVSDVLDLGNTTLLTAGQLGGGFAVTAGIATLGGSTLAVFLAAATTSTTAGVVAYADGGSTYVVESDGLASGANDSVVQLVGITGATEVGTAAGLTTIHIV